MKAEAVTSAHAVRIRTCDKPERVAEYFFMVRFLSNRRNGREVDEKGFVSGVGLGSPAGSKMKRRNQSPCPNFLTKLQFPCGLCRDPLPALAFPSSLPVARTRYELFQTDDDS